MYSPYLVPLKQLIAFYGDAGLIDSTIEKLYEQDQGLGPKYQLTKISQHQDR
jgi:hypothetical protein